jgi:dipeptidyl aminopeptidase/acylaminoacyl peptidase
MKTFLLLRCFAGLFLLAGTTPPVCSAQAVDNSPRLFAPGVISGAADDLSPAFAPDGKTVFFTRGNASGSVIMVSTLAGGRWSAPVIAPFSGKWNDLEASMSPDGAFLVFASNRPAADGGAPLDGNWGGKSYPARGGNLWRVDRTGGGWAEPKRLPETINASSSVWSPSVSSDGSIYFMKPDNAAGSFHLYRSQYRGGTYLSAVSISVGSDTTNDVDPAVAPDESFLVYSSHNSARHDPNRLRIVFRTKDGWGAPVDLGDEVNEKGSNIEARLGPGHVTLYFSTNTVPPASFPRSLEQAQRALAEMQVWANGSENIWYVSLASWVAKNRGQ